MVWQAHMVKNFTPINERLCVIRISGKFFNNSLINIMSHLLVHILYAPTNDSEEETKDQFYEQLERAYAYAACSNHDEKLMMVDEKLMMGDASAKVGRETVHQPTIDKYSLHESTNENCLRLVDFAAGKQMAIKSTYFMHKRIHFQTWHSSDGHTFNQIDHCLIDGRHFSDVIDVMARRGVNIDSNHMLVVIKLRARICRASNTKPQHLRRFAVDRLKDLYVVSRYYNELESEHQGVQAQRLSLDEKYKNRKKQSRE
jgi:hypothetical protein